MESTESRSSDWDVSCDIFGGESGDLAFKWSPSYTRDYEIVAEGSGFDVVIAVFDADCSTELECEDTSATGGTESLTRRFYAGSTYYIVVTGYYFSSEGMVSLTISPAI